MWVSEFEKQTRAWERRHPRRVEPENAAMYDEMLRQVEIAAETALSEVAAFGVNYEAYDDEPRWLEIEPWDDGYEPAFREMYEAEIGR